MFNKYDDVNYSQNQVDNEQTLISIHLMKIFIKEINQEEVKGGRNLFQYNIDVSKLS